MTVESSFREHCLLHSIQENTNTLTYWFENIDINVLREFRQYIDWRLIWHDLDEKTKKEFEEDCKKLGGGWV